MTNAEVTHDDCDTTKRLPGAYRTSWGNRWFSMVKHRGKRWYLGTFPTPEEAHEAYVAAKRSLKAV